MPETELKFDVAASDLKRLAKHPAFKPRAERARLRSAYFDTPELALREAGLNLRVRSAGGRNIQTVKASSGEGLFDREEWEVDIAGKGPDPEALALTPAAKQLNGHAERLQAVFVTAIERGVRLWTQGDAVIEISVDRGEIKAGQAREPVLELELELKSGPKEALYALAEELAELAPLRLSFASKSERGYRLAAGEGDSAVKASELVLAPDVGVAEAFRLIMRSCLLQLSANAQAMRRAADPEVLHQARIGLRRLRAALTLFKDVTADDDQARLKGEARWIGRELNAARDLDVFLAGVDPADKAFGGDPAVGRFVDRAGQVREQAYARAVGALESPRFAQFVLKTALWVEAGPWTRNEDVERSALRRGPIGPFAATALDRRFKSLRKQVKDLAHADAETRHEVRIKAKKLRYGVEFFAGVFADEAKRRKQFQGAMRALQDGLGVLNDIATARDTALKATGGSRSSDLSFAAGLVVGKVRRGEPRAMKAAIKAAEDFAQARRFWS